MAKKREIIEYPNGVKVTVESDGTKFLFIGNNLHSWNTQAVIYPNDPHSVDWFYPNAMLTPMLITGVPKKVLVIGLGGGMLVRMLKSSFPDMEIVVVEISEDVIKAAHDHFMVGEYDYRLIHQDGLEFLKTTDEKFDWILSDAFWAEVAQIAELNNKDVYTLMKSKLTTDGVLVVNTTKGPEQVEPLLFSVFRHVVLSYKDDYETDLLFGFNFTEPRYVAVADLEKKALELNALGLPCKTDFLLLKQWLLQGTANSGYRLKI